MTKERLDRLLVSRGLVPGRRQAYTAVITGLVKVNGATCRKPDQKVESDVSLDCESAADEYVSRGGRKLEKALTVFDMEVAGQVVLDAGASTGGFTDCLLQNGAARVFAVDVGYGQLAWRLRQDERVTVMERTNVRYMKPADLDCHPDLATIDVSFIALSRVLPAISGVLEADGEVLALVKPQFEVGKGRVGRDGVVRLAEDHLDVLVRVARHSVETGWSVIGLDSSPLLGPKGNIEFWLHLSNRVSVGYSIEEIKSKAAKVVADAHTELVR